jgi:hypothetical protein
MNEMYDFIGRDSNRFLEVVMVFIGGGSGFYDKKR